MRLFPAVLGIAAAVLIPVFSRYRSGFPVLSSLGSLTLTLALFLVLITVIDYLNRSKLWKKAEIIVNNIIIKIKLTKNKNAPPVPIIEETGANDTGSQEPPAGGLMAIKKETSAHAQEAGVSLEKRVYSALYIVSFLGIAFWRVSVMYKDIRLFAAGQYRGSIVDAVLLLVLPCAAVLYLKMRKDRLSPLDSVSRDILKLFAYTSLVYAGVIAASAVLKINLLVILPWVYRAVSAYLIIALAVNIALSMLQDSILNFNYTLFPQAKTLAGAPAQAAKWKVSLKSLYTIRYTLAIVPALALALGFVLFLSTAVFVVQPHQQAAVYHFGKLDRSSIKSEGVHLKFPWPIDKAVMYDVHRAASMQIGYESSGTANFLWTQMHDGGEYMLLLGNGNEMAAVNIKVIYVISDLYAYITTYAKAESLLSAAAYNALMSRTVNTTLDTFLSVDRNSLSASVLEELSRFCRSENLGFSVVQVIVESIHPPVDLANVYQGVVSASVDKTSMITRAHAYAEAKVIEAHRYSQIAIDGARAMQYSKVSDAQKEAVVFDAAAEAYRNSGSAYELAKNLDVYEKIIKNNKLYVFSRGAESGISQFIIGKFNTANLWGPNEGEGNE